MPGIERSAFVLLVILIFNSAFASGSDRFAPAAETARPLFWGTLIPGPYRVGFSVRFGSDKSRTWKVTRQYAKPFSPDENGRPVRVEVWYPALPSGTPTGKAMAYRDYINFTAPKGFEAIQSVLRQRDELIASLSAPKERLSELLSSPVVARRDATPAVGRFPVVIHFPGLNDAQALNVFVMAEYLASHGYVVVTAALLGLDEADSDQHRTPAGLEAVIRDSEFAWTLVQNEKFVDKARIGVTGESLGGVEAVLLAARNGNVSAIVSMEGTYGFSGATQVLTGFYDYSPKNVSVALLDLRKDPNQQQTVLDLSPIDAMALADRTLITLDHMHHSDFTSFAVVGNVFDYPNTYKPSPGEHAWSRETGYKGYMVACEIVKGYLDATLQLSDGASARFRKLVGHDPSSSYRHIPGTPIPPSPQDLLRIIREKGLNVTAALVRQLAAKMPIEWIVDYRTFNSFGYRLLNEKRPDDALSIFLLNFELHPTADAADSLGDGYIGIGNTQKAIESLEKAIELLPSDAHYDDAGKKSMADEERQKIAKLKAGGKP